MITVPQQVLTELQNICKKSHGLKINLYKESDNSYMGGLEFDESMTSKTREMKVNLGDYLKNLLTFNRTPIKILVNEIPLHDIEVKYLEHNAGLV